MPEGFERCRKAGGKIRTVVGPSRRWGLEKGEYMHICIGQSGGVTRGEIKPRRPSEGAERE